MKIGVLGTGMVGQIISAKLAALGHPVVIGTRDVKATMAKSGPDQMGNPPFRSWHETHPDVKLGTFAEAATHGEILVNVLSGHGAIEGLRMAGADNIGTKVVIDVSNPLDFSKGMPPSLLVSNNDSLGEQIQRELPKARVVKTLNTVNAYLMVEPRNLANGDHTMFVSGNDAAAKQDVTKLLKEGFGWKDVIDLGDITNARGTEMMVVLWARLYGTLKTPTFGFKIVR
jgi:8-hydroxy-5-deazaflavin:NADPH oxidoreductase